MIDYVTWLLDESETEENEEEVDVLSSLPRKKQRNWGWGIFRTKKQNRQTDLRSDEENLSETLDNERESEEREEKLTEENQASVLRSNTANRASVLSHALRERALEDQPQVHVWTQNARGEKLYRTLQKARSLASFAEQKQSEAVALPASLPVSSNPQPDLLSLDRFFERDARRYDHGFSLY